MLTFSYFPRYQVKIDAVAAALVSFSSSLSEAFEVFEPYFPEIANFWSPTEAELKFAKNGIMPR